MIVMEHNTLAQYSYMYKASGYKVITTNGCFDLLHPGHVEFLQECTKYGDVLMVFLNSDRYIAERKRRPIFNQWDRARMVDAFSCVNIVTVFDDEDPTRLIKLVRPDVHVNAASYGRDCIEADAIRGVGGELVLIDNLAPYSTTDLINMIKEEY